MFRSYRQPQEKNLETNDSLSIDDNIINHLKETTFIHGSSSAVFAFFKALNISSLLATGILIQRYNCFPISGELDHGIFGSTGSIREGVNNLHISGYSDPKRLPWAIYHSQLHSKFSLIETSKWFINQIRQLKSLPKSYNNLIKNAKLLEILKMRLQQIMLMDENWQNNKIKYVNELESVLNSGDIHVYTVECIKKMLAVIKSEQLPFRPDRKFRELILNQFPIVWVSNSLKGESFKNGFIGEHLVRESINLKKDIQMVITSINFHKQLKTLLDEHQLNHISIIVYKDNSSLKKIVDSIKQNPVKGFFTNKLPKEANASSFDYLSFIDSSKNNHPTRTIRSKL